MMDNMFDEQEEFLNKLKEKYPHAVVGLNYLEILPGWFGILDELMSKIEEIIKDDSPGSYSCSQVKEKFGGLRVSCITEHSSVIDIIHEYEDKSFKTCELCSAEVKETKQLGYWIVTYCEDCYITRKNQRITQQ